MAKFDITKNAKETIKTDNLIDYGLTVVGAAFQTLVPTLLGLNGWGGFATAYGVPLLAGVLLGKPILVGSTINAMSTHLMYYWFDEKFRTGNVEDFNEGKGIWALEADKYMQDMPMLANNQVPYGSTPAGARLINVGGDNVAVYDRGTMNDYIEQGQELRFAELDDYIAEGESIQSRLSLASGYSERL